MKSRADWAIACALAATTLAVCLYFSPRGFHLGFVDMGHDGYQLQQALDLSRGGVIFRDTFDQYGPLNGYVNTIGFVAFGRRLLAMKYFVSIWYAFTAVALFAMARRWLDQWLSTFTVLLWLAVAPFYGHGIMISPHAYVLFLQTLATVVLLGAGGDVGVRRYALVGLLAGLCWALKQSMGVLYLMAVLSYLTIQVGLAPSEWRRIAKAATSASVAFFAVVGVSLGWLWSVGALSDWYLQTVAFPREFYLARTSISGRVPSGVWGRAIDAVAAFINLQRTESLFWIVIRGVVFLAAAVQIMQRTASDTVLIALITAFLWLAAYPSANFMHQWWTASLALVSFVACIHGTLSLLLRQRRVVSGLLTVAVAGIAASYDISLRAEQAVWRARELTETLQQPPLLRGIKTVPSTWRAYDLFVRIITEYRSTHPGTGIVTIEGADGWDAGMIETLLFLTAVDDNRHDQPVYWSLPVLSTRIYPRYAERLWQQIRSERPLVVDHRFGKYRTAHIAGYRILAAARSDNGTWYLFAPDDAHVAEAATYLRDDGSIERGFDDQTIPKLARRLSPSQSGMWRGAILPPPDNAQDVEVPGGYYPVTLRGLPRWSKLPINIYTWPADLPEAIVGPTLDPPVAALEWRGGKYDIVREFESGAWRVDGNARLPSSYLLQWAEEPVARTSTFVARGNLEEGGVEIGFLSHGTWAMSVCVERPGRFEAVLTMPAGVYGLVVANCIPRGWWKRASQHPLDAFLSLFREGHLPNRFTVSQAGWVAAQR